MLVSLRPCPQQGVHTYVRTCAACACGLTQSQSQHANPLQSEIGFRVTNAKKGVSVFWDLPRLEERLEQMRELYQVRPASATPTTSCHQTPCSLQLACPTLHIDIRQHSRTCMCACVPTYTTQVAYMNSMYVCYCYALRLIWMGIPPPPPTLRMIPSSIPGMVGRRLRAR